MPAPGKPAPGKPEPGRPQPGNPEPGKSQPGKPGPLPSLVPFVVIALVLLLIYVGVLLFPAMKSYMHRQDCIASGQTDCDGGP